MAVGSMTILKILLLSIPKCGRSFHFFESSQFSFLIFYVLSIKAFASLGLVQFSHSVMSSSLWLLGLQHSRPPCPSPTPRVHSNSSPLSRWCHPTISSSVFPPSPPAFNLTKHQSLFKWVSSSQQVAKVLEFQLQISVLPMISFRTDWFDLLAVQGMLKSLLHTVQNDQFFGTQLSL